MKSFVRLPVFYIGLVLIAILLVLFEGGQEQMLALTKPSDSFFRLPNIQISGTSNESASGGYMPHAPSGHPAATEPPRTSPDTSGGITTVTQRRDGVGEVEKQPSLKTILVWTFGYGSKTMGFGEGDAIFKSSGCEVNRCFLTDNRTLLSLASFDAIVFHFRSLKPNDLPAVRSPRQRWVFFETESASYVYQDPATYNGLFNWTMTYRLDSDVQQRYGRVYPVPSSSSSSALPTAGKERNYAIGKTKMAAWFVSNCYTKSMREKIVRFMKRYIQVDVYGKCGRFRCPRETTGKCYDMLGQHYKFYLSFENSLCKDYVTEKLFSVLRYDVVPVVFGMANYTNIAPPHSFINVLNFPNLKKLVKYLKYLDSNDTAYNEYFKWKGHYLVQDGMENTGAGYCDLCKRLYEDHKPKVYMNIREWFVGRGGCMKLDARSLRRWNK